MTEDPSAIPLKTPPSFTLHAPTDSQDLRTAAAAAINRMGAVLLAALYAIASLYHAFGQPSAIAKWTVPLALVTVLALVLIAWLIRSRCGPESANACSAVIAGAALLNSTAALWLTGNPMLITNHVLLVMGASLLMFSRMWFMSLVGASFAVALLPTAWVERPLDPAWWQFAFGLLVASGLSALVFEGKDRLFRRLTESQEEERLQRAAVTLKALQFRQLFELSPGMVCVHDLDGSLLAVNCAGAEALGYPPSELVGRNIREFLFAGDAASAEPYLRELRTGDSAEGMVSVRAPNGAERLWQFRSRTLTTSGSSVIAIGSAVDQTERVQAVSALERAREALEERVKERTQELEFANLELQRQLRERERAEARRQALEDQLRQAQKLEALGTLSSGIAHDFNNVLMLVQSAVEAALATRRMDRSLRSELGEVLVAVDRGRLLVRQILAFGRPTSGTPARVRVAAALQEAATFLRASLPRAVRVVVDCGDVAVSIRIDPVQFQQVLVNLGTNALHAMESEGGTMRMSCVTVPHSAEPAGPGSVLIAVTDTGRGIPPDALGRVFDPFYTTKDPGRGSGLGLSVVRGIVSASGGTIDVQSTPGTGTTFVLSFPEMEPLDAAEPDSVSAPPSPRATPARILLIDDEQNIGAMLQRSLARRGYSVSSVSTVDDALEQLSASSWDLVITDYSMPAMNGLRFAMMVQEVRPEVSVVLMTGMAGSIDPVIANAAGIAEILEKPVSVSELSHAIERAIGARAPALAGANPSHPSATAPRRWEAPRLR